MEMAMLLPDNNHWFSSFINIFRFGSNRNKLYIIIDSEYLSSSLSFNIFLCNILAFIIEQAMGVSTPSDTSHINFILGKLGHLHNLFTDSFSWGLCCHYSIFLDTGHVPTVAANILFLFA